MITKFAIDDYDAHPYYMRTKFNTKGNLIDNTLSPKDYGQSLMGRKRRKNKGY